MIRSDQRQRSGWTWVALLIALPALMSLSVVVVSVLNPDTAILNHLLRYVLPRVTFNTVVLVTGVAVTTAIIGVSLAWLTAVYHFPGRKLFTWALLLPMAVPGYVIAFVAIGLLEYSGPVQTTLRDWFSTDAALIPVRSTVGVIIVMSLALYPYVYLLARNAFLTQGRQALEVARSLGLDRRQGFWKVALPMARPWIAGGLVLVVMETLADFGTVSVFNYDTFTTAIYQSWFSLQSVQTALQLALLLLVLVVLALLVERQVRGGRAYTVRPGAAARPAQLTGAARWIASLYATLVLLLAFVIPAVQLGVWSLSHLADDLDARYAGYALRSLLLSVMCALLITALTVVLVYAVRVAPTKLTRVLARVATLGYALPGTVLAVGIYTQLSELNGLLNNIWAHLTDSPSRLFLQGTLLAMVLALVVRFTAVAYQAINSAMQRLSPRIDDAARSLGVSGWRMIVQVHVPILRSGMLTAAILVFVDVMKEMPITLMTRPFGWDTLAVRVFEMTSEGQWEMAALPALSIVVVGLIPVILVTRASAHAFATR